MEQMFSRNKKERDVLSPKHIAIVGLGSGGSATAEMAVRTGVGQITLIDPETLAEENIGRHMLTDQDIGRSKVDAMRERLLAINPECQVDALTQRFSSQIFESFRADSDCDDSQTPLLDTRPDVIVSCVDSFGCESTINGFCLQHKIPAVYGGVWGAASVGEILYVVPGRTACYECYAGFRRSEAEIPNDPRKYTDPEFDHTKTAGQPGLWPNILVIASVQFQVVLGIMGLRDCIDHEHSLWLVNVSDYDSGLQPLAVTFGKVKKGCAVCDPTKASELEFPAIEP